MTSTATLASDLEANISSEKLNETLWHKFKRLVKRAENFYGSTLAILYGFIYALSNVFFKKTPFFNGAERTLTTYVFIAILVGGFMLWKKISFWGTSESRRNLCMRGFFGVLYVLSFQIALSFIQPSDVIALARINIIIVAIVSRFLFKEMLNFTIILAILFTIAGKKKL